MAGPTATPPPPAPGAPVHPGPSVRGDRLLVRGDQLAARVDAWLRHALSVEVNPLLQTGTMAIALLVLAVASGIVILIWYSPSVTGAYPSLAGLGGRSLGGFIHSLHRYSSDACLLYVMLHASRMLFARKITESRWLAWVTGTGMLGLLWFIGWTGYWLVWDERAQLVATASIRVADALHVFAGTMARLFLSDRTVPSLLFFIVFFLHILLPLGIAGGLAVHLARLSRPRITPARRLAVWVLGAVGVAALLYPATSARPAHLLTQPESFPMDWWFLWPLQLAQRLGGPATLALFAVTGLLIAAMPWWMRRRRPKPAFQASVDVGRCHACTLCVQDCPFDAITMVARTDGKKFPSQALVDPARCVGCGICVGACDADSIELPWINTRDESREVEAAIEAARAGGEHPLLALVCAETSGGDWNHFNTAQWRALLPDFHVWPVPCVGWAQPKLLERVLARGAVGMLVISCGEGELRCREGGKFFQQRIDGTRQPALRSARANPESFFHLVHDTSDPERTRRRAAEFARTLRRPALLASSRVCAVTLGLALCVVFVGLITTVADAPFRNPAPAAPEFVLSVKAWGEWLDAPALDAKAQAARPIHMRSATAGQRTRATVMVRLAVEGVVTEHRLPPLGLEHDGASIAVLRQTLSPGSHEVEAAIFTAAGATAPKFTWRGRLVFSPRRASVLSFDPATGFIVEQ